MLKPQISELSLKYSDPVHSIVKFHHMDLVLIKGPVYDNFRVLENLDICYHPMIREEKETP